MGPRTYAVTGAASGIGEAVTELLRARGEYVITIDRAPGVDVVADLATAEGRARLAGDVGARAASLDGVIACAGVPGEARNAVVQVNYFGVVATLTGLRELLAAGSDPRAVVVSSFACILPAHGGLLKALLDDDETRALELMADDDVAPHGYSSTKLGVNLWVRRQCVSERWAGAGITLNAVAPGIVHTPMAQAQLDDREARAQLDALVPMPLGHCQPRDIAEVLAFLASPAAAKITGQVLFVDGGADAVVRGDGEWALQLQMVTG